MDAKEQSEPEADEESSMMDAEGGSESEEEPGPTVRWQFSELEAAELSADDTVTIGRCMPGFAPSEEGFNAFHQRFDCSVVQTEDPTTDTCFVFLPNTQTPGEDGFRVTRIELMVPLAEEDPVYEAEIREGYARYNIAMDIWSAGPRTHKRDQLVRGALHVPEDWAEQHQDGQFGNDLNIQVDLLNRGGHSIDTILEYQRVALQRDVWQISSRTTQEEEGILTLGLPVSIHLYPFDKWKGEKQLFLASGYSKD